MEPKVNYMLVGLFLALLGAALVTGVLWLSRTDYRGVYDRYYAYMEESVSGLSRDSYVRYHGVEVGRVKDIILDPRNPERVRLTLEILRGTPIKEDTMAVLETQGLTGITTVNLRGGTRAATMLTAKPGEEYPVIKSQPSFYAQLSQTFSRLMANEQVPALIANFNSLAQDARSAIDQENRLALKQILGDLAKLTQTMAAHRAELSDGIAKANQAVESFAAVGRKMDERLPEVLAETSASLSTLRSMSEEIARAGALLGATLEDSRPEVEQFTGQTLAETGLLVSELRQLTASLQRVAEDLEREPSALIFGRARPARGPGE
jgi:phospholipid/cholesterol/gamma-HCH transport system substrate-binding protein